MAIYTFTVSITIEMTRNGKIVLQFMQKALTETYIFISEVEFILLYQVTT